MCSYFCSSFSAAVPHPTLSFRVGLASSAIRRDTSQRVAYGNQSQLNVYLYEIDKHCAEKEVSQGFEYFAISNQVYQLGKGFQKIQSFNYLSFVI